LRGIGSVCVLRLVSFAVAQRKSQLGVCIREAESPLWLREVRRWQSSDENLLPPLAFLVSFDLTRVLLYVISQRLVKRTLQACSPKPLEIEPTALLALKEAAQAHLVDVFEQANLFCVHAKRVCFFPVLL